MRTWAIQDVNDEALVAEINIIYTLYELTFYLLLQRGWNLFGIQISSI